MFCPQPLVTTAMTTLSSKIINVHKKKMAKIAVDAVMAVANLDRNDVNFDMIKVCRPMHTFFVRGISVD